MSIDTRMRKSFKRFMGRIKTVDATFRRKGVAAKTLPVHILINNDLTSKGEYKNRLTAKFYKIEGDAELVGQATLAIGDELEVNSVTYKYSGETVEENRVAITAHFDAHSLPFFKADS